MTSQAFTIEVADTVLDDLRERLLKVRWSTDLANEDWRYGANAVYLKELVDYWLNEYDWRKYERALNTVSHFRVDIGGTPIHFIHEKGKGERRLPLILTHGWPWTFWCWHKLIGPLTDPAAYGGNPDDGGDPVRVMVRAETV